MKPTEENINYLRIALNMAYISVNNMTSELILTMMEGIQKKKGEFSIQDAAEIETKVKKKYELLAAKEAEKK